MIKKFLGHIFATVIFFVIIGAAIAQDPILREGDQLNIRIGGVPFDEIQAVTGIYTIDGSGFLNMPHIGNIKAAGSTQGQVQTAIENAYKSQDIYTNPSVMISISSISRFVDVGGDVKVPQRVPYTSDLTVLGAISAAGGFTDFADQGKVRLLRDGKVTLVNIKQVRKDPSKDILLLPGDKIEVPQSFW